MKDLMNSLAGKLLLAAFFVVLAIVLPGFWNGSGWNEAARKDFYTRDQGSRIMPLAWMQALKQPNGEPFLADSLSRYGYLPNASSPTPGLPVGFVAAGPATTGATALVPNASRATFWRGTVILPSTSLSKTTA